MPGRYWINTELKSLDPAVDYARMVDLILNWRETNPFLHHLLYTLGFIKQVADPKIAQIIHRAGAGSIVRATAQRGDETLRFFGTWWRYGPDSEKGRESIVRLNAIHSRFPITNEQYLYTLATLVVLPDEVYARISAPQRPDFERKAMVKFWQQVGREMNLVAIPEDYQAFEKYYADYEASRFAKSEAGQVCAEYLLTDFVQRWFPNNESKGRRMLLSLFDERLKGLFEFEYPGGTVTTLTRWEYFVQGSFQKLRAHPKSPVYVVDSFSSSYDQS